MQFMLMFHMLIMVRRTTLLAGTPREELATYVAQRHALSVAGMRFRGGLGTSGNGLAMQHRKRGARALDSSTSPIAHR